MDVKDTYLEWSWMVYFFSKAVVVCSLGTMTSLATGSWLGVNTRHEFLPIELALGSKK